MKSISFVLIAGVLLGGVQSLAQSSLEGFSTGRYEVHKSTKKRMPTSAEDSGVTDADGMKVKLLTPSELAAERAAEEKAQKESEAKKKADKLAAEQKAQDEKKAAAAAAVAVVPVPAVATVEKPAEKSEVEEPSISEQAESLFSSKQEKVFDFYRQEVHPDDVRNNKVEIEFSPVVAYNDSQSNYSFRRYQAFFEALKIKANVWLTPLIGLSGQMLFSFGADVDDAAGSRVATKYENMDLALNFRKFFGVSRLANSLEFSVIYSDESFKVSNDSTRHPRLKTSGLGVGLKGRFPTSVSYAWTLGGSFFPRLQHSESATAVDVNSGSANENIRVGFDVGGEWKFSRHSQMLWNLGVSSERNLFSGAANLPDPSTGKTPSNVSVTNTMYMLNLGYRWGH